MSKKSRDRENERLFLWQKEAAKKTERVQKDEEKPKEEAAMEETQAEDAVTNQAAPCPFHDTRSNLDFQSRDMIADGNHLLSAELGERRDQKPSSRYTSMQMKPRGGVIDALESIFHLL